MRLRITYLHFGHFRLSEETDGSPRYRDVAGNERREEDLRTELLGSGGTQPEIDRAIDEAKRKGDALLEIYLSLR